MEILQNLLWIFYYGFFIMEILQKPSILRLFNPSIV